MKAMKGLQGLQGLQALKDVKDSLKEVASLAGPGNTALRDFWDAAVASPEEIEAQVLLNKVEVPPPKKAPSQILDEAFNDQPLPQRGSSLFSSVRQDPEPSPVKASKPPLASKAAPAATKPAPKPAAAVAAPPSPKPAPTPEKPPSQPKVFRSWMMPVAEKPKPSPEPGSAGSSQPGSSFTSSRPPDPYDAPLPPVTKMTGLEAEALSALRGGPRVGLAEGVRMWLGRKMRTRNGAMLLGTSLLLLIVSLVALRFAFPSSDELLTQGTYEHVPAAGLEAEIAELKAELGHEREEEAALQSELEADKREIEALKGALKKHGGAAGASKGAGVGVSKGAAAGASKGSSGSGGGGGGTAKSGGAAAGSKSAGAGKSRKFLL